MPECWSFAQLREGGREGGREEGRKGWRREGGRSGYLLSDTLGSVNVKIA